MAEPKCIPVSGNAPAERRTNGLRQSLFAGAVLLLLSAIVAAVWGMRGHTANVASEVSLYAIQLRNTETSFQMALRAHERLDAHDDAGDRIRLIEIRLERIESALATILRRLNKIDKDQ